MYYELKIAFILFLILDKTHGCVTIYEKAIEPLIQFRGFEQEVDSTLAVVQEQLYNKIFSQLGGVKDLGMSGALLAFDKVRQLTQAVAEQSDKKQD